MSVTDASSDRLPWRTTVLGGFASYIDSAVLVAGGTAWVLYQDRLGLSTWDIGALSAILTFSLAVGALVGGRLGDAFGRKRVFSVDLLVLALGLVLLVVAPSVAFLYAGVVVAGFAMGADIPVSLALIAEEAPPAHRSRLVAFSQVMWLAGIVASMALGFAVSGLGSLGARILFLHVLVVSVTVWVLRQRLPESRRWSDAVGEAERRRAEGTRRRRTSAADLVPWAAPIAATALFYTFNNISANTIGQFQTFLFVTIADSSVTQATFIGLVTIPVGLGANLVFMRIVGRPTSRTVGFAIGTLLLAGGFAVPLVAGISLTTLVVAVTLSAVGGGLAGEAIYKVWSQELFPTLVRGSAQGSTIFFTRAVTAAFAFVTPAIAESSPRVLLAMLVGVNLVAGAIGLLWVNRLPKMADAEDDRGTATLV